MRLPLSQPHLPRQKYSPAAPATTVQPAPPATARVQLADVLAGSAAHVFGVATGAKAPDRLARDLVRVGVADHIFNAVGPEIDETVARAPLGP